MTEPVAIVSAKEPVLDQIWELEGMDAFHKAKRVALLFASACLVVSLNVKSGDLSVAGTMASVSIDPVTLWWMFALGAAYYSYAAVQEFRILLVRSAPFAIQFAGGPLRKAFADLEHRLHQISLTLEGEKAPSPPDWTPYRPDFVGSLDPHQAGLTPEETIRASEEIEPQMLSIVQRLNIPPNESKILVTDLKHEAIVAIGSVAMRVQYEGRKAAVLLEEERISMENRANQMRDAAQRFSDWQMRQANAIKAAEAATVELREFTGQMSPKIARNRRQLLWWWEAGAPVAFGVFCLVVGMPEIASGLSRLADLETVAREHVADVGCGALTGQPQC